MILLSKLADYGVILAAHLARRPGEQMTALRLADETGLPRATVAKLLKQLAKAGVTTAARGATGGYRLARPAGDISVADVVTAIDGTPSATECAGVAHSCDYHAVCPTRPYWQPINDAIVRALSEVPLSRMAGQGLALPLAGTAPAPARLSASTLTNLTNFS